MEDAFYLLSVPQTTGKGGTSTYGVVLYNYSCFSTNDVNKTQSEDTMKEQHTNVLG